MNKPTSSDFTIKLTQGDGLRVESHPIAVRLSGTEETGLQNKYRRISARFSLNFTRSIWHSMYKAKEAASSAMGSPLT